MSREIWILRHSIRRESEPGWNKHPRYKENHLDPPLTKKGIKLAEKGGLELIQKSEALQNKEIKFIYCSPFTRCIQTAIEIIDVVKEKLKYDIKLIIVYNLGERQWWPIYNNHYNFSGDKLKFDNIVIDAKLKPAYLKKKYKKYIGKIIGSDIKDSTLTKEIETIANEMININNTEKESYILVGHMESILLAYKYYNQNKRIEKNPEWIHGGHKNSNIMMGFLEKNKKYKMIYKPNNKF